MIKKFQIGDVLKELSTGKYSPGNNLWFGKKELKISGIQRYDVADENDTNRPIKDLADNDYRIDQVINILVNKQFPPGIAKNATLSKDDYNWRGSSTASLKKSDIISRLTQEDTILSIPFILPLDVDDNSEAEVPTTLSNIVNNLSNKLCILEDGLIIGQNGNYYVNKDEYELLKSIIQKVLFLETWKNDTVSIEKGDTKRFKANIVRKANGLSLDDTERELLGFEFDYLDGTGGLVNELISKGFDINSTNFKDILNAKINNRFALCKSTIDANNTLWNFLVLNETNERIEVWYSTSKETDGTSATAYTRYEALDEVKSKLDLKNYIYTIFYSIPLKGSKDLYTSINTNGYQEFGLSNKKSTDSTGLDSTKNYYFRLAKDGDVDSETFTEYSLTGASSYKDLILGLNALFASSYNIDFRIINGDVRCTSLSGGSSSKIELRSSQVVNARFVSDNISVTAPASSDNFTVELVGTVYGGDINKTWTVTTYNANTWGDSNIITLAGLLNQDILNNSSSSDSPSESLDHYVEFTVDDVSDKLVLRSKQQFQGSSNSITIAEGTGNPLNKLGITAGTEVGSDGEDLFNTYPTMGISDFIGLKPNYDGSVINNFYVKEIETLENITSIKFYNQSLNTINTQQLGDEAKDPNYTPIYKWNGDFWIEI